MKLDSTIISALIIGASIFFSTVYYAKNTDYQSCVREHYKKFKEQEDAIIGGMIDQAKLTEAYYRCGFIVNDNWK